MGIQIQLDSSENNSHNICVVTNHLIFLKKTRHKM